MCSCYINEHLGITKMITWTCILILLFHNRRYCIYMYLNIFWKFLKKWQRKLKSPRNNITGCFDHVMFWLWRRDLRWKCVRSTGLMKIFSLNCLISLRHWVNKLQCHHHHYYVYWSFYYASHNSVLPFIHT